MAPGKRRGRGSSAIAAAAAAAQQWNVGDLVLAKVKGFPAWPAQVADPVAFERASNPTRVFVVFFGTKQIRSCQPSEISAFTPEVRDTLLAKSHLKGTTAELRRAVTEICELSEQKASGITSEHTAVNGRDYTELVDHTDNGMLISEDGNVVSCDDQDVDSGKNHRRGGSLQAINHLVDNLREEFKILESGAEDLSVEVAWPSVASDVDSSSLDGNSDDGMNPSGGIVIPQKVQTNFASHEELDSFEDFEFFREEAPSLHSEEKQKVLQKSSATRQTKQPSRRSSKAKKPEVRIPTSFPKKRRQSTSRAPAKDKKDEEHQVTATVHDTACREQESTSSPPPMKRPRTPRCDTIELVQQPLQQQQEQVDGNGPSYSHDPDDHLPIVKRARVRKEGSLPPKAEKYRLRSTLADSEAALPPSKRLQRAYEAMAQAAMQNSEEAEAETATISKLEGDSPVAKAQPELSSDMKSPHQRTEEIVEAPSANAQEEPITGAPEKQVSFPPEIELATPTSMDQLHSSPADAQKTDPHTVHVHSSPCPSRTKLGESLPCPASDGPVGSQKEDVQVPEVPEQPQHLGDVQEGESVKICGRPHSIDDRPEVVIPDPRNESLDLSSFRKDVDESTHQTVALGSSTQAERSPGFMKKSEDENMAKPERLERLESLPKLSKHFEEHLETRPSRYKSSELKRQSEHTSPRGVIKQSTKTESIPPARKYSPKLRDPPSYVSRVRPEATSPVMRKSETASPVTRKWRDAESKPQLEKPASPTSLKTSSREAGKLVRGQSERSSKGGRTKQNTTVSPVTSKHGTDTSSLLSEKGVTDSHSGESLASESEHTSARTRSEGSSFRSKLGVQGSAERNGSGKLDATDLTLARGQSDGEVNKVRAAYEAAKLAKLASKDGDASMRLLEVVQSKHTHAAVSLSSPLGGSRPSEEGTMATDLPGSEILNNDDRLRAEAMSAFEGMVDGLSHSKDSILRATRQAVDCSKLDLCQQVIDFIAKRLELEQNLHRRIDLFFLVDSISQASHNLKGSSAGVYRSVVQTALPRLLTYAAPPGTFARENRKQCLKVFKLWNERGVFPPTVIRHFMHEIEQHNGERLILSRRPTRNERPVDDPIRDMEGMQVDEYGSNATSLPGLQLPRMFEEDEDATENGYQPSDSGTGPAPADETSAEPAERHTRVLEEVDGELEMEDVSPVSEVDTWSKSPASILGPPLPPCPPPSPPPLPSSPPPSTPPPPPPSSPPPPPPAQHQEQEGFLSTSPGYPVHKPSSYRKSSSRRRGDYDHHGYRGYDDGASGGYGYQSHYGEPGPPPAPPSPYRLQQQYPGDYYRHDYGYQGYGHPPHPSEAGPSGHWPPESPRRRDRSYKNYSRYPPQPPPPPPPDHGYYEGYEGSGPYDHPPPYPEHPPYEHGYEQGGYPDHHAYDHGMYPDHGGPYPDHAAYPEHHELGPYPERPPPEYYHSNGPPPPYARRGSYGGQYRSPEHMARRGYSRGPPASYSAW